MCIRDRFRRLTGLGQRGPLRLLTQAPFTLHEMLLASIRREAAHAKAGRKAYLLSLIHISEPTRPYSISYAVFCLKQTNKSTVPDTFLHAVVSSKQ